MEDPTLLEYLKEHIRELIHLRLPRTVKSEIPHNFTFHDKEEHKYQSAWIYFGILGLALIAQGLLEWGRNLTIIAAFFYCVVAVLIFTHFDDHDMPNKVDAEFTPTPYQKIPLFLSIVCMLFAFVSFSSNRFTASNLTLWIFSMLMFIFATWARKRGTHRTIQKMDVSVILLASAIVIIALFFRVAKLGVVPAEMFSDHAEKLLDVADVLRGQLNIFFPRNTGREALQFYLTAGIIKVFGTGLSYLSLKIGTVLAGLLTLPFIYLIAKEIKNSWTGLAALFMASIAYWPNVISRVALRFAFYPFFSAPAMYYFIRGMKTNQRNHMVIAGFCIGFGLQGYSPFRIVPIFILIGFMLKFASSDRKYHIQMLQNFAFLVFAAILGALPLIRYALDNPLTVGFRAFSRVLPIETTYSAPIWKIFLQNSWNALMMFFQDNGEIWVHSIPHRPALDWISATFFFIGFIVFIKKIFRYKKFEDLFILGSVYFLLLPSILSLAYPTENPSLNRTAAAYVPVFIIAGIGFEWILRNLTHHFKNKITKAFTILITLVLVFGSIKQNYDLVFKQYANQFRQNAWNTSEIGAVIKNQIASGIREPDIYVIPYPYWVDTRLVGINAGFPLRDFALSESDYLSSIESPGKKIYILKPEDDLHLDMLIRLLKDSQIELIESAVPGKDFVLLSGD